MPFISFYYDDFRLKNNIFLTIVAANSFFFIIFAPDE